MFDATEFRELVSGQKHGPSATLIRTALHVPAAGYAAVIYFRNKLFDWSIRRAHRVDVPVISVGNLTVGGTGKSPFVLWLAQWLTQQGIQPAVLSRGYGAEQGHLNDEALELRLRAPNLLHLQSADRVQSARRAIAEFHAQALILDDGFQHRRLARDLDIVLIDASEPFGYGHLLPRGLLREPMSALSRAQAVVLTRADQVSVERKQSIQKTITAYTRGAVWADATFVPTDLLDDHGTNHPLSDLRSARVFGFAAIGQPDNFRRTLRILSGQLVGFRSFPDHHRFSGDEFLQLLSAARSACANLLVCTCKDLVKIPPGAFDPNPVRAIRINTHLSWGSTELEQLLSSVILPKSP